MKSSDARSHSQPGTSNQGESRRPQMNCTSCSGTDHLRKTVMKMSSAIYAEPDPTLQKCAVSQQSQLQVILFVYIVVVLTTHRVGVVTNLMTIERNQGQHRQTSEIKNPRKPTAG